MASEAIAGVFGAGLFVLASAERVEIATRAARNGRFRSREHDERNTRPPEGISVRNSIKQNTAKPNDH
jgi:hypothetical protein